MTGPLESVSASKRLSHRWRWVAVLTCICALMLAIAFSSRPLTIQFHRVMWNGLYGSFSRIHGSSFPDGLTYRLFDESQWHLHRLVSLGYLERQVHRYHSLRVPSPDSKALLFDLRSAVGRDCDFSMGQHDIVIYAPPGEIVRLMAIVQKHDFNPAQRVSSEPDSE